jgi:polyhydroxyalkanoate synthesis regulator phasin
MADMGAKIDTNQAKAEVKMERQIGSLASDMKANQARMEESLKEAMRLTVSAIEEWMEAIVHSTRSERDEKIQRRIENVTERQEIPKEGAAVARLESEE